MYYPYGEDVRVYLFSPTAGTEEGFSPFFYTSRFLNDDHYDWSEVPNENLEEWYRYLNEKVDKRSIEKMVYNMPYDTLYIIANRKVYDKDPLCDNKMAEYIMNNELDELAAYLLFTRKVEMLLGNDGDPWTNDDYNIEGLSKQIEAGKKIVKNIKDDILKQRYAYHVIVMMRYLGEYENAIKFYNDSFNEKIKNPSIIKYWALNHVAFCKEMLDLESEAHLDYTRVFLNCHAKKKWVYTNMSRKSALSVLDKAEDEEDKYAILSFSEFKNPGRSYEGLKQMAAINPNSETFKTLINREVNKIEDWLLTTRYTNENPTVNYDRTRKTSAEENYKSDFKYAEKIIGFLEGLLLENKLEDRGFYELILAHLYFVHESPKMSLTYLNRAEKNVKTPLEKHQLRMTRVLNLIINTENYDADFENKVYQNLTEIMNDEKYMKNENKNISNLMLALQQSYHKKGMHGRAALFMAWAFARDWDDTDWRYWHYLDPFFYLDKYADVKQVKQFRKIYAGNNKTKLEQLLLADYEYSKYRFWDLIGTKYMRKDDLQNALEAYQNVPDEFWRKEFYYADYLGRDVFAEEYDSVMSSESDPDSKYVNKANIVEALIKKKKAYEKAKGKERTELAFLLGNAYYNLSYNGSHWYCLAYMKMAGFKYNGEYDDTINDNYNTCNVALGYFEEAFDALKGAKYMSDEEWLFRQVSYSIANIQSREKNKQLIRFWKKCLKEIEENNEEFYRMAIGECPDIMEED